MGEQQQVGATPVAVVKGNVPENPGASASAEQRPTANLRVVQPEAPMRDVMEGAARWEVKVHDHGFLALVDVMPRLVPEGQTADCAIVQAARVSYGAGTKKVNEDRGLIRYLLRHRHTTPFEMVEFKFHVAMPIFVARQWIRHRTANVNEYSGRYSIMPDTFYKPTVDAVRKQSASNRQGGSDLLGAGTVAAADEIKTAEAFIEFLEKAEGLYEPYRELLEKGVSRELARIALPVSLYTQWYWKCDLHNLLRFLSLRLDAHAQLEIRDYAQAMLQLVTPIVPTTLEAWMDYDFGGVSLSRLEVEALQRLSRGEAGELDSENKRERDEWIAKLEKLGFKIGSRPA
ncbi:MAG: FAD-dependent thymidylate synthase [Planctomycetota bacterium]|nr:FAD-dependent thymidylate synthase [Planctomycetota bacterium]